VTFAVIVAGITLLLIHGRTNARGYAPLIGLYTLTIPQYSVGAWADRIRAVSYLLAFEVVAGRVPQPDGTGSGEPPVHDRIHRHRGTVERRARLADSRDARAG
jgi:hypothetical protein